jgi:flagellin
MPLRLNTSMMSLQALMGADQSKTQMQKSLARMASGQRLNSASDGAAELNQAIKMQSEQLSNMAAQRNTHDGLSMVQTAEGATGQTGEMLSRMRELSVQASSETINDDQRGMIQTEITSIQAEMDRIAGVTEFNGVQVANGTSPAIKVQVGTGDKSEDTIDVELADLRADSLGVGASSVNVATTGGATSALDAIDTAMDNLNGHRAKYGAAHNRLSSSVNQLEVGFQASVEAESRIMDTDYAFESAETAKSQMLMDMGLAAAGQANRINQSTVRGLISS